MAENLWLTILLACLGSSGFFALVQFLLTRVFKKKDAEDETAKTLKELRKSARISELNDYRTHVLILINHFPQDHQAILTAATDYFRAGGDSWLYNIVCKWAEKEDVNVDYISELHIANLSKKD